MVLWKPPVPPHRLQRFSRPGWQELFPSAHVEEGGGVGLQLGATCVGGRRNFPSTAPATTLQSSTSDPSLPAQRTVLGCFISSPSPKVTPDGSSSLKPSPTPQPAARLAFPPAYILRCSESCGSETIPPEPYPVKSSHRATWFDICQLQTEPDSAPDSPWGSASPVPCSTPPELW